MSEKLKPCRYCGGKIKQYTHEGRSFIGQHGYISVCYCICCGMQVKAFDENPIEAERKAAGYWNRGIYDGRQE